VVIAMGFSSRLLVRATQEFFHYLQVGKAKRYDKQVWYPQCSHAPATIRTAAGILATLGWFFNPRVSKMAVSAPIKDQTKND
jgi:hypothetical protein